MGSALASHDFTVGGDPAAPRVRGWVLGAFQENGYLVSDPATGAAALVDPGADGDALVEAVREQERAHGVRLEAVWLTHAHIDHVGALREVHGAYEVPAFLHALDVPVFAFAPRAAAMYGLPWVEQPMPDRRYAEGDVLALGELRFTVMHAPGHAPGHVVVHGHGLAFVGDCLFHGSVGRTDLPLSDPRALQQSLARIAGLPADTTVFPGHGPATTIGYERVHNPFLNGSARVSAG